MALSQGLRRAPARGGAASLGDPRRSVAAALALALLLLLGGLPASLGALSPVRSLGASSSGAPTASATPSALSVPTGAAPRPASTAPGCSGADPGWQALYDSSAPPPDLLNATTATGCLAGADEEGVGYLSNLTGSGSRLRAELTLPADPGGDARGFGIFALTVAVSGVGCSLGNLSILSIDLLPPSSPWTSAPGDVWSVQAPVWSLTSPGSCDPRCQNGSAIFHLNGSALCEDNAVARGIGSPGFGADPELSPGDAISLTVRPSPSGLIVELNDSTSPSDSFTWNYSGARLVDGLPIAPAYSTSGHPSTYWGLGAAVGVSWTNCPELPAPGLSGCTSYDGPGQSALAFPKVVGLHSFDPSNGLYDRAYGSVVPWSSSQGCSATYPSVGCTGFASGGGTSSYPPIDLLGVGGAALIGYGSNGSSVVGTLASASQGFDPSGAPVDPAIVSGLSVAWNNSSILLSARATDPFGVASLTFGSLWCSAGGGSTTPSLTVVNGTRGLGPLNGTGDADFSAVLPRGSNTTGGAIVVWARENGSEGGLGSLPVFDRASIPVPRGGLTCSGMAHVAPIIPVQATPIAEGYEVDWAFPAFEAGLVRNFSVGAFPTSGSPVAISVASPNATSARIVGLAPSARYTLYIGALFLDGSSQSLGQSTGLIGQPTLRALSASVTVSFSPLVEPSATLYVNVSASGGMAPYTVVLTLGNGWIARVAGTSGGAGFTDPLGGFQGPLLPTIVVTDALGVSASVVDGPYEVSGTPQAVPLTLTAGDNLVTLSWSSPVSPSALLANYTVFYSQDPLAPTVLTSSWPSDASGAHTLFVLNTSATTLTVSATDGLRLYAMVVAWDSEGPGLGPSGPARYVVPQPFDLLSFAAPPLQPQGGAAPLALTVSAVTSSGGDDPLIQADFSIFALGLLVPATIQSVANASSTRSWANATLLINESGTWRVEANLDDRAADTELLGLLVVYVGPGVGPVVHLTVASPVPFVGHPVSFSASSESSPGPFSYQWTFGDGSSSGSGPNASASHVYGAPGSYTVAVTVSDRSTGGSTVAARTVAIFGTPTVRIAVTAGSGGPGDFDFAAIESGGSGTPSRVGWLFGDGTLGSGPNATHTYLSGGRYNVSVNVTDPSGLTATAWALVDVPSASSTSPPSAFGSLGLPVALALAALLVVVVLLELRQRRRRPEPPPVGPDPNAYRRPPPTPEPVE